MRERPALELVKAPPAPSPGRVVLVRRAADPFGALWPAIVVEVRRGADGEYLCDVHPFATRGHGAQALRLDVLFAGDVELAPGDVDVCFYPPRV